MLLLCEYENSKNSSLLKCFNVRMRKIKPLQFKTTAITNPHQRIQSYIDLTKDEKNQRFAPIDLSIISHKPPPPIKPFQQPPQLSREDQLQLSVDEFFNVPKDDSEDLQLKMDSNVIDILFTLCGQLKKT